MLEENKSLTEIEHTLYPVQEMQEDAQKQVDIHEMIEKHSREKQEHKKTELTDNQIENKYVEMTRISKKAECKTFLIGNIKEDY